MGKYKTTAGRPTKEQQRKIKKQKISENISKGTKDALHKQKQEKIDKLEDAFKKGMNVEEAKLWAGISTQTYYNYKNEFPQKFEYLEALRDNRLKLKSKITVSEYVEKGDYKTAIWVLENDPLSVYSKKQQQNNFFQQNNFLSSIHDKAESVDMDNSENDTKTIDTTNRTPGTEGGG